MKMTIPVIDISQFYTDSKTGKEMIGQQIDQACRDIGFFCITGHSIAPSLINETFEVARQFFDLPLDEKLKISVPPGAAYHGYTAIANSASLAKTLNQELPPDWREYFYMGKDDIPETDNYYQTELAQYFFAPNLWSSHPLNFRTVVNQYFNQMEMLSTDLMRLFAIGLGLPDSYFDSKVDKHGSHLILINYPEQHSPPLPGQLRASPHTDFGTLTIVCQDSVEGGLQILSKAEEWIDVDYIPGALVINIGDLMARWTNDRWTSTLHRVVNPSSEVAAVSRRQSFAYFHQPNYNTWVECLEGCADATHPRRYPPILREKTIVTKSQK
ncbi:MAG: isopenicillin N synthase family oxygenase [Leptolyngbyaceae cyanobacterium SL_7_1]|nr:isopenicillin N synthase family oxygenase [Leptolyngbyaceae cyanobacterium SL_7_1]